MQIPVLIEAVPGNGFRARGGEPFALVGEGPTPEDALTQFKNSVTAKLQEGAQVALVEVRSSEHTWLPFAGMFQDNDPLVQEWLRTVQEERNHPETSQ